MAIARNYIEKIMATVEIQTELKIKLQLDKDEALYLKGLLQNCLGEEGPKEATLRYNLFHALPTFEELTKQELKSL
jgi:hypothetical protein